MERDFGDPFALNAVGKPFAREGFERRLHAVEPLVAQDILDHRAAEERWVMHEKAQHLLHFAPPLRPHETIDEGRVDLEAKAGRRDQRQARHPVRLPMREIHGNGATHRMADEMHLIDRERGERAIEIGRKARAVNRPVERLGRAAMAGQVERNRAAGLGEGRLVKHPGIEVGAKAVHEQDRDRVAGAEIEHAQPFAAGFDVARRGAGVFGGRVGGRLGCDKAGDKGLDLGIGYFCGSGDREQRADRQCRPGLRDDAAQRAAFRGFEDIGDLCRLDFEELFAGLEAVALVLQPAEDFSLGHRQTPFRHRDRGDLSAHSGHLR